MEAKYLDDLKSTNVIGYQAVAQPKMRQVDIFMEYADNGDLAQEIERRARARNPYSKEELMDRFADCVKAVGKAHENNVVHRDIKPQNIFLNKKGMNGGVQAKLGDFGVAAKCSPHGKITTPIGTPLYLDPQRVQGRAYGQKADIWSLGCVLYEMAALKPAIDARSMPELKRKVAAGKFNMGAVPDSYGPEVKQMIGQMLQVQEPKRPTIQDLLKGAELSRAVKGRSNSCPPALDRAATILEANRPRSSATNTSAGMPSSRRGARDRSASPAPRTHARGRATDIAPRPPTSGRARSRSPVVDAASRIRAIRGRPTNAVTGRGRARSVSPSQIGARRASGANGPSPLAGGDVPRERQMTPEAPHVAEMIAPKPSGPITASKIAPNQAAMGPARRALVIPTGVRGVGKQNPWALPPIESGRHVNPWRR